MFKVWLKSYAILAALFVAEVAREVWLSSEANIRSTSGIAGQTVTQMRFNVFLITLFLWQTPIVIMSIVLSYICVSFRKRRELGSPKVGRK